MPDQDDTRARILTATRARLYRQSAQFVGLRELAAGAKVSAALIVQIFGSKDELVAEVRMLELEDDVLEDVAAAKKATAGREQIQSFFALHIARQSSRPWVMKDLLDRGWQWSGAQLARYEAAISPMRVFIQDACRAEWKVGPTEFDSEAEQAAWLAWILYETVIRETFVRGEPASVATERMRLVMQQSLSWIGAAVEAKRGVA